MAENGNNKKDKLRDTNRIHTQDKYDQNNQTIPNRWNQTYIT